MPEGHTVHRIARLFDSLFTGQVVAASSPQGRFAEGAKAVTGRLVVGVSAIGKQLFIDFDNDLVVRVHLGIYGAWDVATLAGPAARAGSAQSASLGAPRVTRRRLDEAERERSDDIPFPPAPVGAVRLRLETPEVVADVRGPTACEVVTPDEAARVKSLLGPDPLVHRGKAAQREFRARLGKTRRPIGQVLMDQTVVSGIGNVYRAEILFRHRLDPFAPAAGFGDETAAALWADWRELLADGVKTGVMLTRDDLDEAGRRRAMRVAAERYWVYKRQGQPCRVCGTRIALSSMASRKLYFCPACQVGRI